MAKPPARAVVPCRWLFLAATGLAVGAATDSPQGRALVLAFLAAAAIGLHLLPRAATGADGFLKFLLLGDALLVALLLLVAQPTEAALTVSFLATVLLAGLVADRWRTLLAAVAVLVIYAATLHWATMITIPLAVWARFVLLAAAAPYFGVLAERVAADSGELARFRRESGQLRALLQITDTITRTLELRQVMIEITRRVSDLVGTRSCSILLADQQLRRCFVVASHDDPDVDMLEIDLDKYPEIRKALESGKTVVIDDVESDPLIASVRDVLLEKGYRSVLVLPLLFGREVLGTLFLRASRERPFTPAEIRFCMVAAGASANALKNALLYREMKDEAERHRETGEKLRRLLDGTPDLIVATDPGGRITEFNRGAEELTAIPAESALGRPIDTVVGWHERSGGRAAQTERASNRREMVIPGPDGEREINLVTAPLHGPDQSATGMVYIGRDMTKLRRVERSLAQAERLSSLGEVVAGVAHELNNPLSGVVGYAELLRLHIDDPAHVRDLDRILVSARRCQRIVLNLLSFSRKHCPEKKIHDLNTCIRSVLELKEYHLRASQIEPLLELDPDLPSVCFDFHQIEQVVLNLINNAEQAMQGAETAGRLVLRTRVEGKYAVIEIQDNGPGVPQDARERIFDPFFTTKEVGEGTGLGLSVSFGIVQEHGGRIELRPDPPGGGAHFAVYLPRELDSPTRSPERDPVGQESSGGPLRGRKVLIAEDEPVVRDLFSRILREDGAMVTLARDGEEAWERLIETDFDLVVTDIRMPRLDGQRLYERVAETHPELLRRFVFATGDMVREETVKFLESLPNRILSKPLQIDTVRRVLAQAVAS